jgi:hypothetical protein
VAILYDFVLRLALGLAFAMALTSPRQVTSGYYRIHSYVLLGLFVLASMVALGQPESFHLGVPLVGAVLSYVSAVTWLYERHRAGVFVLGTVAVTALSGVLIVASARSSGLPTAAAVLHWLNPATGGFVLGTTIAAMFLGHWYLNSPTMKLGPLRRLIALIAVAVALRAVVAGVGCYFEWATTAGETIDVWLLTLRWLAGIVAPLLLSWMAWKTLDVPNTQSATGILYVAVVTAFTGELTSQLLSTATTYPV